MDIAGATILRGDRSKIPQADRQRPAQSDSMGAPSGPEQG
jgi:hypothetical protein